MQSAEFNKDASEQVEPAYPLDTEKPQAWEMIDAGRYKPRRIRGSFLGGDLG